VGHDRYLFSALRTTFLVKKGTTLEEAKKSKHNMDFTMSKSGSIGRVMDEYFLRNKVIRTYIICMLKSVLLITFFNLCRYISL